MLRITSFFIFLCLSSNVLAIDLSGSYFGIRCKNNIKCVDGEYGTGLLGNIKRNIQIFPKNKSDKRALLLVHHNIEENLVSILSIDGSQKSSRFKLIIIFSNSIGL